MPGMDRWTEGRVGIGPMGRSELWDRVREKVTLERSWSATSSDEAYGCRWFGYLMSGECSHSRFGVVLVA